MKNEEIKTLADALKELKGSYMDVVQTMTETTKEIKATKRLWRKENNSILIKLGLALIAFPDPTISDIIGTVLVAAGTVQMGIRRRSIYVEDAYKSFRDTLKEIHTIKDSL
jgi:hypothetical protein